MVPSLQWLVPQVIPLNSQLYSNQVLCNFYFKAGVDEWKPLKQCQKAAKQSALQWPTSLTLNPFDQSLYFLDGDDVIQLKQDTLIHLKSCYKYVISIGNLFLLPKYLLLF